MPLAISIHPRSFGVELTINNIIVAYMFDQVRLEHPEKLF